MEFVTPHLYIILFALGVFVIFVFGYFAWNNEKNNKKSFWKRFFGRQCFLYLNKVRILILLFSVIFVIFSALRPVWGEKINTINENGSDVIFVLDVSNSMKALDMSISRNILDRLTAAKLLVSDFVSKNPENRYGLILFAGEAFVSSPLTFDTQAFNTFLNIADTRDVSLQGTDLSKALSLAINRFSETNNSENEQRGRMIVLISDGGEETPQDLPVLVENAKKSGIRVVTLGIGGDKKVPIPESTDMFGSIRYKRHNGQVVYTTLNEEPLKELANRTDGLYIRLKSGNDLEHVASILRTQKTTLIKHGSTATKKERYSFFLSVGFLLFVMYLIIHLICSFVEGVTEVKNNSKKI